MAIDTTTPLTDRRALAESIADAEILPTEKIICRRQMRQSEALGTGDVWNEIAVAIEKEGARAAIHIGTPEAKTRDTDDKRLRMDAVVTVTLVVPQVLADSDQQSDEELLFEALMLHLHHLTTGSEHPNHGYRVTGFGEIEPPANVPLLARQITLSRYLAWPLKA